MKTADGACGATQNAGTEAVISNSPTSDVQNIGGLNLGTSDVVILATTTPISNSPTSDVQNIGGNLGTSDVATLVATSTEPIIIPETATTTP